MSEPVRMADLTPPQRRLVAALIAARPAEVRGQRKAVAATGTPATAQPEVRHDRATPTG
jgi:hypothetical protein